MNNYFAGPEMKVDENCGPRMSCPSMEAQMPMPMNCCPSQAPVCCNPIYECPQEKVCQKVINYEVPHILPCHTRIINHHVYRHTYTPTYSSCEENVVSNVYDGNSCC